MRRPRDCRRFARFLAVIVLGVNLAATACKAPQKASVPPHPSGTDALVVADLRLDLTSSIARWSRVLTVPLQGGTERGALHFKKQQGLPPLIPTSFAVDADGYWFVDPAALRLVHFTDMGELRTVLKPILPIAGDLAPDQTGLLLIERTDPQRLRHVQGPSLGPPLSPEQPFDESTQLELAPTRLVSGPGGSLGALTAAGIRTMNAQYQVDAQQPGVPLTAHEWLPVTFGLDGDLQTFEFGRTPRYRYRLLDGYHGPTIVSNLTVAVTEHAIHLALRTSKAGMDGYFYVQLARANGAILAVDHMPAPRGVDLSFQDRFLATSREDVFWMDVSTGQVAISRR